jgi:hypothetical protein
MAGDSEVNKIIVESENDKHFINRLIEVMNLSDVEIEEPICNVDEFICLDGMANLGRKLRDIKLDDIDKLGIVLDADSEGIGNRLQEVNTVLREVGIDVELESVNRLKRDHSLGLDVTCHIFNIDGYGELENVLFAIKTEESIFADCLDSWRKCLKENGKSISKKGFLKFWTNNYIRFDTCSSHERKQVNRKCNFESALQKDIWDFSHSALDSTKEFLRLFQ